jgi:hypothetical protein
VEATSGAVPGVRDVAQTNLQLYDQLVAHGWSDAALADVRRAYELATELFAGQLRPSGKTFVAHTVGTASALAAADARPDLVRAGLLHAAYTHGEFGDGRRGVSRSKRAAVRKVVGPVVEQLVADYTALGYTQAVVDDWTRRASALSAADRDQVVLRLANEVDDHADLGLRFCDRGPAALSSDATFAALGDLAEEIGEPVLAELIRHASMAERDTPVPAVLRSEATRSWTVAPRSYRLRLGIAVRRTTLAQRLRRSPIVRRAYEVVVGRGTRR